ncbi:MAG: phosphopantetheine-binding protein [Pseudomonadota bacterium]
MNSATDVTVDLETSVRGIVADALSLPVDQVVLDASLMDTLGAESLDFLDIVFKLERSFGIQITRGELERAARGDMSEEDFAPDGWVSPAGLTRLRELMPEAADNIQPGLHQSRILSLFTVQTLVHLVQGKQQQQQQQQPPQADAA